MNEEDKKRIAEIEKEISQLVEKYYEKDKPVIAGDLAAVCFVLQHVGLRP